MDSSKIEQVLTLRYLSKDSNYVDVDTPVPLYKYPYSSEKVFIESARFGFNFFWDIAINEKYFFFHLLNSGLYEYNRETQQSEQIYSYEGGDYIAASSDYVFCSINEGKKIVRFNIATHTLDCTISFSNIYFIEGLAVEDQSLYALILGYSTEYIKRFSLAGALQDSIPIPVGDPYFMAIHDSILYFKDGNYIWNPNGEQISRFDLRTKRFLSNVLSPAKRTLGFKTYKDDFYFMDFYKKFVGVVPISYLIAVQSAGKKVSASQYLGRMPH